MEETKKIQCSCGQESQLVLIDGKWRFDAARHGNGEPCEGKCFNCHAPLKDDEIFPPEPVETPEPIDEHSLKEVSMSMTKKELLEVAGDMALEVPKGAKKAEILELIEQAEDTEEQKPEDE